MDANQGQQVPPFLHSKTLPGTGCNFQGSWANSLPRIGGVVGHRTAGNLASPSNTCLHVGSIGANDLKRQGQRHLPHRLRQWKYGTRLIDGIDHLDNFGFSYFSVLIRLFILSYWLLSQCIRLALKNWLPVWRGHRDRVVSAVKGAFEHPLNTYVCR